MTEKEKQVIINGGVRTSKWETAFCRLLRAFGYPVKMGMGLVEVGKDKHVAMPTIVYEEKK